MKINIKKLTETAILPERGSAYAAGYDLFADVKEVLEIAPHTTAMIPTGLAMEIPEGYWGGIFARSGLASKESLRPANCVGVVDAQRCIRRQHRLKRQYTSTTVFICHFHPYSLVFCFSSRKYSVTEFTVIRTTHFLNIKQNGLTSYVIVG